MRDFTYDEDRCRAYVRHLPRNLACLTNEAIAIVRCDGRFRYLPEANRHYAARGAGGPRRDHDRAHRLRQHASPPDRDVPPSGAGGPVCLSNPKTPSGGFEQSP